MNPVGWGQCAYRQTSDNENKRERERERPVREGARVTKREDPVQQHLIHPSINQSSFFSLCTVASLRCRTETHPILADSGKPKS